MPNPLFRAKTADNSEEYATIAYVLYWNRRYGLNEVQHDDLRRDSEAVLSAMTGGSLEYADSLKSRQISGAEGRDYVRIVEERLSQLANDIDAIPRAATDIEKSDRAETLRQFYHSLTLPHANEFRQFKDFLANLNAALIEFGRRPQVDMQDKSFWRRYFGVDLVVEENVVYRRIITDGEELDAGFRNSAWGTDEEGGRRHG